MKNIISWSSMSVLPAFYSKESGYIDATSMSLTSVYKDARHLSTSGIR